MTDWQAKLMKIMSKYQCSGNGHGNRADSDEGNGGADGEEDVLNDFEHKDDDCKNFLGEKQIQYPLFLGSCRTL